MFWEFLSHVRSVGLRLKQHKACKDRLGCMHMVQPRFTYDMHTHMFCLFSVGSWYICFLLVFNLWGCYVSFQLQLHHLSSKLDSEITSRFVTNVTHDNLAGQRSMHIFQFAYVVWSCLYWSLSSWIHFQLYINKRYHIIYICSVLH